MNVCNRDGALLRLYLNGRPNPVAELAATAGMYASFGPGIKACAETHSFLYERRARAPRLAAFACAA